MRLTIFGGTGPTGQLLINLALSEGHDVTAYARTPGKLPTHPRLTAIQGTLQDAESISRAVEGSDAVLSLLGPTTKREDIPVLATGYGHVISAMKLHGVTRLVAMGTPSIVDPADGNDFRIKAMVAGIRTFQRPAYDAIVKLGELIRGSGLDWTIVRFPILTNGAQTTTVNARHVGQPGGVTLSRANAAAYFLAQASEAAQIGQAPFVTDK